MLLHFKKELLHTTLNYNNNDRNQNKKAPKFEAFLWYHLESNQGHTDFQSVALPTELWYPSVNCNAKVDIFSVFQNICIYFCDLNKNNGNTDLSITK